ncbi:MAG: MaoC family dehydratase N-terminal domain-containing protein, partial [Defluviimonas sp.]|nr:MaoC family dehydratase N-terminal domain-containing protein [Defluviimonas sp.]
MKFENRPLADIRIGDSASLTRLLTTDDLYVFATASGNHNPMHLTLEDTDHDGRPDAVAPGMFVASLISAVLGMKLPGPGTLYRSQVLSFHERAHADDELVTTVTVNAVAPDGQVTLATEVRRKSDNALIVDGEALVIAPMQRHVW